MLFQSVVITLVNSSTYQTYVASGTQQSVQNAVAFTLFGLACLTFGISMLICFLAGFVTGKVAVLRRMGFLTGFVAGAIIYTLSFLLNYIPGYPTHLAGSGVRGLVGVGSGILVSLHLSTRVGSNWRPCQPCRGLACDTQTSILLRKPGFLNQSV